MLTSILTKLGTAIFGSNEDLSPMPQDDQSSGKGDSDDTDTEQDDESGEGGESGESGDDEQDGDSADSESGQDGDDGDESDGSGDGSEGDDGEGSDDGSDGGDTDGDQPGDSDGDDGKSDSGSGDGDGSDKTDDSDSGEQTDDVDPNSDKTAGGHDDQGEFAEALIDGLKSPQDHILDAADALQQATDSCRTEDDVRRGEQVWRPYDPEDDLIAKPKGDKVQSAILHKEAKLLTAALRTQFRRRFLAARNPREQHGVRRGRDLSERRLVESFVEIKSGVRPSRPDYKITAEQDVSLCLGVVIDQSGSMHGPEQHAAAVSALAMAEAFDSLNAPVMVCGPRNGGRGVRGGRQGYMTDYYHEDSHTGQTGYNVATGSLQYHRHERIVLDVFKDWDESFKQVKHRFSSVQATGSTPLSDGIQFALQELSNRPERHRIIVVLTDGEPDNRAVVKRQIRLAREAGITVIGVGISGAEYAVPALFVDHHIVVNDLRELPKRMIEVVGAIVFPRTAKRAALDGRVGSKRARRRA